MLMNHLIVDLHVLRDALNPYPKSVPIPSSLIYNSPAQIPYPKADRRHIDYRRDLVDRRLVFDAGSSISFAVLAFFSLAAAA